MVLSSVHSHVWCSSASCERDSEDVQALLQNRQPLIAREEKVTVTENQTQDDSRLGQDAALLTRIMAVIGNQTQDDSRLGQAASFLTRIMDGKTGKAELEVVLSHYDEDIRWSDPYEKVRTIYCKNESPKKRPGGCIALPNVGREGHAYLYHIVENYNDLADWTVFSQAQAPSQGYKGHHHGGGHMLPGVPFDSFLLPEQAGGLPRDEGSLFVFTCALHMPTLMHSFRLSFLDATRDVALHSQPTCPTTAFLDGWQHWWDFDELKEEIGKKCGVSKEETAKVFLRYWDDMLNIDRPANNIIFFTQGARFAASKERIHQRPKEFYEALMKLTSKDKDPYVGYFNEWAWYYIIGKPTRAPCDQQFLMSEVPRADSAGRETSI